MPPFVAAGITDYIQNGHAARHLDTGFFADEEPSVDTHLITFQGEQAGRRIRTVTVQFLANCGRVEVIRLSFDTPLQLLLPRVVPQQPKRHDYDRSGNEQEASFSQLRAVPTIAETQFLSTLNLTGAHLPYAWLRSAPRDSRRLTGRSLSIRMPKGFDVVGYTRRRVDRVRSRGSNHSD
jgi:hypothetical protein